MKDIDPEEVRRLAGEGWSQSRIAAALGVSKDYIFRTMRLHGITPAGSPWHPRQDFDRDLVAEMVSVGVPSRQIGELYGCTGKTVTKFMRLEGIRRVDDRRPLDQVSVAEMTAKGFVQREIAAHYGVNQATVSHFMVRYDIRTNNGRGRRRGAVSICETTKNIPSATTDATDSCTKMDNCG